MAYIDILLDKISDEALRQELRKEVEVLLQVNQFGLVFQRHQPESARSSNYPLRKSSLVQVRTDPSGSLWRVDSLRKSVSPFSRKTHAYSYPGSWYPLGYVVLPVIVKSTISCFP